MDSKFYSKCEILAEAYSRFFGIEDWSVHFSQFDLGYPCAIAVYYECAELNDKGIAMVEDTWLGLCDQLQIDPDWDYGNLDGLLGIGEIEDEDE